MTIHDFNLLGKKILVGVLVYIIPLVLITAGLLLISHFLKDESKVQTSKISKNIAIQHHK